MATYYAKCGRTFTKSSKAVVTGYRMAEDDEECLRCQYRESVKDGWPREHKYWECRAGSQPPNYTTEPQSIAVGCHHTLHIYTLDLSFIDRLREFAREVPGFGGASYSSDSMADCRKTISVSFESNKSGNACRQAILEFFWPERFPGIERSIPDAEENQSRSTQDEAGERCERAEEGMAPVEAEETVQANEEQPRAKQADDSDTDFGDSEAGMMVGTKERCVAPESGCAAYCSHNGACAILITHGAALEQMIEMVPAGQCGFIDNYLGRNAPPVDALAAQSPTDLVPFDYSVVDDDTAIYLQDKAKLIAGIRIRSMLEVGRELMDVQSKLANHYQGTFGVWVESIGMSRQTAQNYMQSYGYVVEKFDNIESADAIQPSLLMAMSRPSAPPELQEAVKAGEIQSITEWKERLRELHETNDALRKSNQELIRERTMTKRKVVDLESQVEQERTKPDRNRAAFEERIQDLRRQLATVQTQGSPDKVLQLEAEIAAKEKEISMLKLEIRGRTIEATVKEAPADDANYGLLQGEALFSAIQPLLKAIGDMLLEDSDKRALADYYNVLDGSYRSDALAVLDLATATLDDVSNRI